MTESNELKPNATPAAPVLFGARNAQTEPRNWTPLIVGFVLVLVALAIFAMLGHTNKDVVKTADPYASNLAVEQVKLSQADNFVGATVTYIDLVVKNNGPKTVVGGTIQAVFRDTLGQSVQSESLPLRALVPHALGGEDEATDLAKAPLGPGQSRTIRLTVEHISSEWNQAQPDLEFRGLRFK
ncbi:MAG TPA: hypothetical protein VM578_02660 [Candidatus Saccharimonadales bacterium]|nr:hypothetical protein [Candidatus Saccharimonadales bacterium]